MADSTLSAIQTKIRRLTRSLSPNQLSDAQINEYVNTFIAYDMPEHLRMFNLRTLFTFYTIPGVDVYGSNNVNGSPLYQFSQNYLTVHPPVYCSGYQIQFTEDRNRFYGQYPLVNSIASIGTTGDGVTQQFSGVVNSQNAIIPPGVTTTTTLLQSAQLMSALDPALTTPAGQTNVMFSSNAVGNFPLSMIDYPLNNAGNYVIGNLYAPGDAPTSTTTQDPNNFINYQTGEFVVTFPFAPDVGVNINSQTVPQQMSIPLIMLFFDGYFTLRPVPSQVYTVTMEVYQRPTQLLQANQSPFLEELWQYISYGAAKKVFEDRMDLESVQMIMPEYKVQEALCLRRTIVQQTSQRVSTIYTENDGHAGAYGPGFGSGGGSF